MSPLVGFGLYFVLTIPIFFAQVFVHYKVFSISNKSLIPVMIFFVGVGLSLYIANKVSTYIIFNFTLTGFLIEYYDVGEEYREINNDIAIMQKYGYYSKQEVYYNGLLVVKDTEYVKKVPREIRKEIKKHIKCTVLAYREIREEERLIKLRIKEE